MIQGDEVEETDRSMETFDEDRGFFGVEELDKTVLLRGHQAYTYSPTSREKLDVRPVRNKSNILSIAGKISSLGRRLCEQTETFDACLQYASGGKLLCQEDFGGSVIQGISCNLNIQRNGLKKGKQKAKRLSLVYRVRFEQLGSTSEEPENVSG